MASADTMEKYAKKGKNVAGTGKKGVTVYKPKTIQSSQVKSPTSPILIYDKVNKEARQQAGAGVTETKPPRDPYKEGSDAVDDTKPKPGSGGGTGGDGSKTSTDSDLTAMMKFLAGEMRTDPYSAQYEQAKTGIEGAYTTARGTGVKGYDDLISSLKAITNPYADLTPTATGVTSSMDDLLATQGVSNEPVGQYAQMLKNIEAQRTAGATDMMKLISGAYGSQLSGNVAAAEEAKRAGLGQMDAARIAALQGLASSNLANQLGYRTNLMQMLLSGVAAGGKLPGGLGNINAPAPVNPNTKITSWGTVQDYLDALAAGVPAQVLG